MVNITFKNEGITVQVPEGTTLLQAALDAKVYINSPCGGGGTCGKCLVEVDGQKVKACETKAASDTTVLTLGGSEKPMILTDGFSRSIRIDPRLKVTKIELRKAVPGDNRSDFRRLEDELREKSGSDRCKLRPDTELASSLYNHLQESKDWYVVHTDDKVLKMTTEKPSCYMAAFDIGTTTVVGYLLEAQTGRECATISRLNPQTAYGADVIMRANYCLEHGTEELTGCIREAINAMTAELALSGGISIEDIYMVGIVGNTCMHHLFFGISPQSLVFAPYTPVLSESLTLCAAEYGIKAADKAVLTALPNIAGYVGADTCGCLLALRQDKMDDITLMIDIGTNGEMVMGNKDRLVTCSTAAGPAFEGAKIECGMRGAPGAVDHVHYANGEFIYHTVGDVKPIGICGSGLIDLVAALIEAGLVDDTGCLESGQEDPQKFYLVPESKSGNGKGVYLTQRDVREVQLAKAAIAAGIRLMMKELGITEKDIKTVYLAGAFGNYMDPKSAGAIGMIPGVLAQRIVPVGNAAGIGSKIALLSRDEFAEMDELALSIGFVELAASADFQDCFVEELGFE